MQLIQEFIKEVIVELAASRVGGLLARHPYMVLSAVLLLTLVYMARSRRQMQPRSVVKIRVSLFVIVVTIGIGCVLKFRSIPRGAMEGTLCDTNNIPVQGSDVVVFPPATSPVDVDTGLGSVTDPNGRYQISGLPEGACESYFLVHRKGVASFMWRRDWAKRGLDGTYAVIRFVPVDVPCRHLATVSFRAERVYDIEPEDIFELGKIARDVNLPPHSVLYFKGCASLTGSDAENSRLGMKRATGVADVFRKANVPASAMMIVSFGASSPRHLGKSKAANDANRRVEVYLLDLKTVMLSWGIRPPPTQLSAADRLHYVLAFRSQLVSEVLFVQCPSTSRSPPELWRLAKMDEMPNQCVDTYVSPGADAK